MGDFNARLQAYVEGESGGLRKQIYGRGREYLQKKNKTNASKIVLQGQKRGRTRHWIGNGKKGGVCWEKKGVDGDRCRDGFLSIRDVQFTTNDERRTTCRIRRHPPAAADNCSEFTPQCKTRRCRLVKRVALHCKEAQRHSVVR